MIKIDSNSFKENKSFRLLNIYEMLNNGDLISKKELATKYCVSEKTIQRDIEDLRVYLADNYQEELDTDIVYDVKENKYKLVSLRREWLTNKEVMAMAKILLESRGLNTNELNILLDKLVMQVTLNDRKFVKDLIQNERFNYVQPCHGKPMLDIIWQLSEYITKCEILKYSYERQDGSRREVVVKPVGILFSDFYFYLIAYKVDKEFNYPINYRIDRITNLLCTGEKFKIPYKDRFDDGEFRKRLQFMYTGELKKIRFEFSGVSIEAILDRIPTAKIIKQENNVYTLEAEGFGDGTEMWLKTQGDNVKIMAENEK